MKVTKKLLSAVICALLLLIFGFSGCKKDDPNPNSTTGKLPVIEEDIDALQKQYSSLNEAIYYVFKDWYLWNDQVPTVDYKSYSDPQKLIDALKYTKDRWSFVIDKAESEALFGSGESKGQGLDFGIDDENKLIRIAFVYPSSPAGNAGIYRGMIVQKINGKDFIQAINDDTYKDELSKSTITYEMKDTSGVVQDFTITNGDVKIQTVLYQTIKTVGSKKVAYIVFNSFLGTSEAELTNAFADFKSQGVEELVLDLRYNGGGYVFIAEFLASMIAGDKNKGKIFDMEKFNKNYSKYNDTVYFGATAKLHSSTSPALDLSRVFIIASKGTASASELVINGLKPYMTVIQIGDFSHGKPVGFFPFTYNDKEFYPVSIESVNANGEGGYYDGIAPTVFKNDGIRYSFGDPREYCLKEALYYIEHNGPSNSGALRLQYNELNAKLRNKTGYAAIKGIY